MGVSWWGCAKNIIRWDLEIICGVVIELVAQNFDGEGYTPGVFAKSE
jgi:hypothetical protein